MRGFANPTQKKRISRSHYNNFSMQNQTNTKTTKENPPGNRILIFYSHLEAVKRDRFSS